MTAEMAGTVAHTAADGRVFSIRPAAGLEDLERCIALQQETWGYADIEVVPRNIYVLAQSLGGHVLCAWDEAGALAGFAMAVAAHEPAPDSPAAESWMGGAMQGVMGGAMQGVMRVSRPAPFASAPPAPYLHSHLLAVRAEYRSCGLGRALKLSQRRVALAAGLSTMRWTFDPLMARNAAFNLNRIGAVVRHYIPDFYGRLGSVLQGGTPTDRFLAAWELTGPRARAAVTGGLTQPRAAERIALSPRIAALKAAGRVDALEEVQAALKEQFADALGRGLQVEWFATDGEDGGDYLLAPREAG